MRKTSALTFILDFADHASPQSPSTDLDSEGPHDRDSCHLEDLAERTSWTRQLGVFLFKFNVQLKWQVTQV